MILIEMKLSEEMGGMAGNVMINVAMITEVHEEDTWVNVMLASGSSYAIEKDSFFGGLSQVEGVNYLKVAAPETENVE
ncbi:MAG: hypothetical protein ACRDCA_24295 [Serratia sp. (in: enterobacteria)]|uniref:hypothetical protein n=1 Tax=Serratia sp. (in: enterobacteria) TaxID=616 RepID=UPI003F31D828